MSSRNLHEEVTRTANSCIDCWPGRYAPASGASVCHECEAGRSAPRRGTSCTCRPAGMCEDHDDFEVAKIDGSFRQLLGSG